MTHTTTTNFWDRPLTIKSFYLFISLSIFIGIVLGRETAPPLCELSGPGLSPGTYIVRTP